MATREEIVEAKIRELEGKIREMEGEVKQLNTDIGGLENMRRLAPTDASLAVQISEKTALLTAKENQITAIRNQITAKENRLTALINSQQGKFHHIFHPFIRLLIIFTF